MNLVNKRQRLVNIPVVNNVVSELTSNAIGKHSQGITTTEGTYYVTPPSIESLRKADTLYNVPCLLNNDGTPWVEANLFLFELAKEKSDTKGVIQRKASHLMDYKLWIEKEELDYLDFSHAIKRLRPTYLYFNSLRNGGDICDKNITSRTGNIYQFYKFLNNTLKYDIDLKKVDVVTKGSMSFSNTSGQRFSKQIDKRELTLSGNKASLVSIGYVRDDGEDLRPLTNEQTNVLLKALKGKNINQDERLIFQFALDTGARKQTILTLRERHLELFTESNLQRNGCYILHTGPGTGIDTKGGNAQQLHIPKELAEALKMFSNSLLRKKRKEKFMSIFGDEIFESKDDMYLFLSPEGNCRYMSKDDPRYEKTLHPPKGGSIQNMVERIFRNVEGEFPKDFSFHWTRATFAYRYYQFLLPLVESKTITYVEQISFVQHAMGHKNREVTENYLKLFTGDDDLLDMQESWEKQFFGLSVIDEMGSL